MYIHHSIKASAHQQTQQTWRSFGARTEEEEEAYGDWVQQFRWLTFMGVTIVRETFALGSFMVGVTS